MLLTDRLPHAQLTPSNVVQFYPVSLRSGLDTLPGGITLGVTHVLYLAKARHRVSDVTSVFKRLFAMRRKSELLRGKRVALACEKLCHLMAFLLGWSAVQKARLALNDTPVAAVKVCTLAHQKLEFLKRDKAKVQAKAQAKYPQS